MTRLRVSMDIGGTFTDFVVADTLGQKAITGKSPTTPQNLAEGVLNGWRQLIPNPADVEFSVHGTTVGLNAFLERKGARVLLITTAGLRDSYSIARGDRKLLYALQYRKPRRLVPRRDVIEVRERLRWDGTILEPLHENDFVPIVERIQRDGIKAVAICFIHAFLNPVHELRARELLQQALPDLSITLSHSVAQEWREYERASSAVLNAYIAPIVQRYLTSLESEMRSLGVQSVLHVMQSNGGVMTASAAREKPIQTLLSGPVGGAIGGAALANAMDKPNLLCVDMGGTSFDMSLIVESQPSLSTETELQGLPVLMPLVDIHTIGAGGGSIAWLEAGALRVGPQSAGADPGPACYGRGGTQPTVTDANLYLKRLDPNYFLGGRMVLNEASAAQAIHKMAGVLGLDDVGLAEGILAIINAKMADAMRTITVGQGIDPRGYSLVAFGGAGPMHAVWLANELQIEEVVIPWSPGTFSAWGMLQTDLRHDLTRSFFRQLVAVDSQTVQEQYHELETQGADALAAESVESGDVHFARLADMRYVGQEYWVTLPIDAAIDLARIEAAFHNSYRVRYGHSTPGAPVEFVNLRVAAMGRLKRAPMGFVPPDRNQDSALEVRQVVFAGRLRETEIRLRSSMAPGLVHRGPLIIEEETATTVVPPSHQARIDDLGNIRITPVGG